MSGIGTVALVYGLFTLFMVYMISFIFTFREIKLKILAKLKFKRGFGIVEIIKKNGVSNKKLADFSKKEYKEGENSYSIGDALKEQSKYIKYMWGNIPVIMFREGDVTPLALTKNAETPFDLDYYNKTVELAYMTGATEKYGKTIDQLKKFVIIILGLTAVTGLTTLVFLPYIPQLIQALQVAKPSLGNLGSKLLTWLK